MSDTHCPVCHKEFKVKEQVEIVFASRWSMFERKSQFGVYADEGSASSVSTKLICYVHCGANRELAKAITTKIVEDHNALLKESTP